MDFPKFKQLAPDEIRRAAEQFTKLNLAGDGSSPPRIRSSLDSSLQNVYLHPLSSSEKARISQKSD
jgi:hypothetical protein